MFLVAQNTYQELELGIFDGERMCERAHAPKFEATTQFVPMVRDLCTAADCSISDLKGVITNQGPGPFTTLRVVLASVNGLHAACGIPLIGVDALQICLQEYDKPSYPAFAVLLNAFSKDVYYAIRDESQRIRTGCLPFAHVLDRLRAAGDQVVCMGNAVPLFRSELMAELSDRVRFLDPLPEYPTLEQIAAAGYAQYQAGVPSLHQLLPLYVKQYSF